MYLVILYSMRYTHGLPKNNGDPRLFQSYLVVNKGSTIISASKNNEDMIESQHVFSRIAA